MNSCSKYTVVQLRAISKAYEDAKKAEGNNPDIIIEVDVKAVLKKLENEEKEVFQASLKNRRMAEAKIVQAARDYYNNDFTAENFAKKLAHYKLLLEQGIVQLN